MGQQRASADTYFQAIDAGSEDRYLDLRRLSQYSCLSVRTLRAYLSLPVDPLPAYRIGNKLLVRKSEFVAWITKHRYRSAVPDVSRLLNEVMEEFKGLL